MNPASIDKLVLRTFGVVLIAGGVVHWLIIFGVMFEKTPLLLEIYFHSLAVLSPAAGIGLLTHRVYGIKLAMFIFITQVPAHSYMIYLDAVQHWDSGYSIPLRLLDIGLVVVGMGYLLFRSRYLSR